MTAAKAFLHAGLAATIVAIVLLLHVVELRPDSMVERELLNGLHAPGFGVAAILIMLLLRRSISASSAYYFSFLSTMLLALASEAVQSLVSRGPALDDLGQDLLGTLGTLLLIASLDRTIAFRGTFRTRTALFVSGFLIVSFAVLPLLQNAFLLVARASHFPHLASFDSRWEEGFYRSYPATIIETIDPPPEHDPRDGRVLSVQLGKTRYSGLVIDVYPDWTAHRTLDFKIRSDDGQSHALSLRVHDKHHNQQWNDRFNFAFEATPQLQSVSIPLTTIEHSPEFRTLDLADVSQIVIYKVNADGSERLLLDEFILR